MQYRLLASDLDNTLIPFGEAGPRPAVTGALRRLHTAGVPFVVCTGRGGAALQNKARRCGLQYDYAVCANGACLLDGKGEALAEHCLTPEEMYALTDFCEDYDYPLQFTYREGYYAYTGYETFRDYYASYPEAGLSVFDGEDQDRHLIDMPYAACAALPTGALARFTEKYGYLGLVFLLIGGGNGVEMYDITRRGVTKAAGLAELCARLEIPMEAVVAAGDAANDCAMLRAAGLGCCMGNGTDEARAAADRVIGPVTGDGLAGLIAELWPAP